MLVPLGSLSVVKGQVTHAIHVTQGVTPGYYSCYTIVTHISNSWNIMESSKTPNKYHLSINILAEKKTVFPITEKFKTELFSN